MAKTWKSYLWWKKDKYYYTYKIFKKNFSKEINKLYKIYKYTDQNCFLLKNSEENKVWKHYEFQNYFERENKKVILVRKHEDNYEVKFK